ncbi:MAG: hypothetical protein EXR73_03165 [Myxococcales bacterium]|nr:hypothetical protein [Myxococcales bacterium]
MTIRGSQAHRGLAVALLAWGVLAACGEPPARGKPWRHRAAWGGAGAVAPEDAVLALVAAERAEAAARRARTLTIHLDSEPAQLSPMVEPDLHTLRVVEDTVFETLLAKQDGGFEPQLATWFRVSPDGREVRVRLREGVLFHDGKRFSVVDAQYSLDAATMVSTGAPRLRGLLGAVARVEIVGASELRLLLTRAEPDVLVALAEVPMLDAPDAGARPQRTRAPVGTGPYRFTEWKRGGRIRLGRFDRYWGATPAIEEIEFVVEPDGAKALALARAGELDLLPALVAEHWPDEAQAMDRSFAPLSLAPARFQFLVLSARRGPFSDVRVRRAAAHLVDRERIARELRRGLARPVAGPIWPRGPVDGAAPTLPLFDVAEAARLLTEAGWTDADADGVRERDGEKLRIAWLAGVDARGEPEREFLLTAFRKAGFSIEVRSGELAVLANRLRDGEFDVAYLEWRGREDEDLRSLVGADGAQNWGGFSSQTVDAALAMLGKAENPGEQATRAAVLGQLLLDEVPLVGVVAADPHGLAHRRVAGLVVEDGWFRIRSLSFVAGP